MTIKQARRNNAAMLRSASKLSALNQRQKQFRMEIMLHAPFMRHRIPAHAQQNRETPVNPGNPMAHDFPVTTRAGARQHIDFIEEFWCRHQGSNPGPPDYKSGALPTELYRHGPA